MGRVAAGARPPRRRSGLGLVFALLGLLGSTACRGAGDAASAAERAAEKPTQEAQGDAPDAPDEDDLASLELDARAFPLLVWATHVVGRDYYEPGRFDPRGQLEAAVEALGLYTPEFFGAVEGDRLEVRVASAERSFALDDAVDLRRAGDLLEEVLVFTRDQLGLEAEPLHELEYAAINGFLAPLDPHTVLLTPEQHADLGVKTRGHFGGIGAEIRAADRRILVARVMPNSPAERAGLRDGDLIVKIDDQSTVNMSSFDAQQLLRGPVGTEVVVKVVRDGDRVQVTITRDTISIPSVESVRLPEDVGYVAITTFQEDSAEKLAEAIAGLAAAAPPEGKDGTEGGTGAPRADDAGRALRALVVDLRGNSGGLLTQATAIVDQFVQAGELVIVRSAAGRESEKAEKDTTLPPGVPVVVIIDENSASAAEIVSGAIKYLDRGVVIGQDSFGKGTVQRLSTARPYGRELALKLTVAEYRVAGDRRIDSVGVDVDLALLPVQFSEIDGVARYYDEERFERVRQRARTAHLPSARHRPPQGEAVRPAPLRLRYLDRAVDPAEESAGGGEADALARRKLRDPEISIAHALARSLEPDGARARQLRALGRSVDALSREHDAAIVEEARRRRIDWAPRDAGAPTQLALEVEAELVGGGPVRAGGAFELRIRVRNPGEVPAQRVHLLTDCAQDELDGIELLIGTIGPGETVERTVELTFMPWHASFDDRLVIDAHAGPPDGEPDGRAEIMLGLEGVPRPRFAFDYWIVDDPALVKRAPRRPESQHPPEEAFEVVGNGDGLLQPGERVLFAFAVRNDGEGAAGDARAILRNLSGSQALLEEGLAVVGELGRGETASGAFGIDVSARAVTSLPVELDLLLGDGELRESVGEKLRLRVFPGSKTAAEGEAEPSAGPAFVPGRAVARVGEESARLYAGAHASTAVVRTLAPGTGLTVEGRVGDWLAVVDAGRPSRRLWIPADLVELGTPGTPAAPAASRMMIDPPRVALEPTPRRIEGGSIVLRGTATHPEQVRDVMIVVYPRDPGHPPRKVFYAANPGFDPAAEGDAGSAAASFEFEAKVPVWPGSNRVAVVARGADKVERRVDRWVYREP